MGSSISLKTVFDGVTKMVDVNLEGKRASEMKAVVEKGLLVNKYWELDTENFFIFYNCPSVSMLMMGPKIFDTSSFIVKGKYNLFMNFNNLPERRAAYYLGNLMELNMVIKQNFKLNDKIVLSFLDEKKEEYIIEKLYGIPNNLYVTVYNSYDVTCEHLDEVKEFTVFATNVKDLDMKVKKQFKFDEKQIKEIYTKVLVEEKWKKITNLDEIKDKEVRVKIVKSFSLVFQKGMDDLF